MKNIIHALLLMLIFTTIVYCQSPSWIWAKSSKYNGYEVKNIISDNSGNVYITGSFADSIKFDNILLSGQYGGMFVAKFNSAGNIIWAKTATYSAGMGAATNNAGNIYVIGAAHNSYGITPTIIDNDTIFNGAYYLIKLDSAGNVIWIRCAGTGVLNCSIYSYNISTDANCNIYLTGSFCSQTISFSNIILNNSSSGFNDIFVAKYDSSGNVLWARNAGSSIGNEEGLCIIPDNSGNIYLTAQGEGFATTFGNHTINGEEWYFVKYDSSGNVIWAKGGPYNCSSMAIDNSCNLYLTGTYFYPVTFGNITLNNYLGGNFIVKTDSSGNVLWAKSSGDTLSGILIGYPGYPPIITRDINSNLYITGNFNGNSISFDNDTIKSIYINDIFIVKYDSSGNVIWAKGAGGDSTDLSESIITDISGNIYITGKYNSDSITFGNTTIVNSPAGTGSFLWNIFIAKLSSTATEIGNIKKENGLIIYPNPTNGILNIENAENSKIAIYNLLGELVISKKCNSAFSTINVSGLADGTYIIKVVSEKNIVTKKICVIK